jgi:prolyl oligopeptidase
LSPDDELKLEYPPAREMQQVDEYHGVRITDPYRWLEESDSDETRAWIEAQNRLTFSYLSRIPARERIRSRLAELWDYTRYGVPFQQGGRYFFTRNDGLQNQSVLYTADSLRAGPRVLLDPNALSADGTVALAGFDVSPDGRLLAYGLAASGSDWTEWRVREVDSGEDLPDLVRWVKFSNASWTADGRGFFYSRYDAPGENQRLEDLNCWQKLYYHRLGSAQDEDELIYERPDQKEWGFSGTVTDDGRYLVIHVWHGTDPRNRVYYRDLTVPDAPVVRLIDSPEAAFSFIDNDGEIFWFRTDWNAPRGRIIAVHIRRPDRESWSEIVPQAAETLQSVTLVGDRFLAVYLKDAYTQVRLFHPDGRRDGVMHLPGMGTAGGFGGKRTDRETFYSFTGFTMPARIYRYDFNRGRSSIFRKPKLRFSPADYETRQVFARSKDGTPIPMFITGRKGFVLDGSNPTYLYGYGGFNISLTPAFSVPTLAWLEMGGLFVQANLRGGNEYGEEWHQAGIKLQKQNVFDDFISVAQWLIANRYTSSSKLAIGGASNGGLLVGACMTQRPELFSAVLPSVGVLDMLRFHHFTIGWAWISDYGSPDDAEEFKALYAYSPLHNVRAGTHYPAMLITTGDHDDRVVPGHSFKFAATLQKAQAGEAPILIRIETKAGHGAGKPTSMQIDEVADKWAFLWKVLSLDASLPIG